MLSNRSLTIILPVFIACQSLPASSPVAATPPQSPQKIQDIPLPEGYQRVQQAQGSFGYWLRQIPLKSDKRVFLYNGQLKANQTAQYAVLDVTVGNQDLQQCADAVMRLRAEYQYSQKQDSDIAFTASNGQNILFEDYLHGIRYKLSGNRLVRQSIHPGQASSRRASFDAFLQTVFMYCGTLSLEKSLQRVPALSSIMPGDVFVKGGSPGHAVLVTDVAINRRGEKIFQLAQSYMPAQDIHVLKNPATGGAWYKIAPNAQLVYTPEWTFTTHQLSTWP